MVSQINLNEYTLEYALGAHKYISKLYQYHVSNMLVTNVLPIDASIKKWVAFYFHGLAKHCSNSTANAPELLQSCTKPSIYMFVVRQNCTRECFMAQRKQKPKWNDNVLQNLIGNVGMILF